MLKNKTLFKGLLLASCIATAALAVVVVVQDRKIHTLQEKIIKPYEGQQFATIQYKDDDRGELVTVQGVLDFEASLQPPGAWMYEFNGVEAVLTGARVIGEKRVPYSATGNVTIHFANGGYMSLYGTAVKPPENDRDLIFYMVDTELMECKTTNNYFEGRTENEE